MGSPAPFDSTPEFQRFKSAMKHVIAVPKEDLAKRLEEQKGKSLRKDNPRAPGRKRTK